MAPKSVMNMRKHRTNAFKVKSEIARTKFEIKRAVVEVKMEVARTKFEIKRAVVDAKIKN